MLQYDKYLQLLLFVQTFQINQSIILYTYMTNKQDQRLKNKRNPQLISLS